MSAEKIEAGRVFAPMSAECRDSHRRIVAMHADLVAWSNGGDRLHYCKRESFAKWVKRSKSREISQRDRTL